MEEYEEESPAKRSMSTSSSEEPLALVSREADSTNDHQEARSLTAWERAFRHFSVKTEQRGLMGVSFDATPSPGPLGSEGESFKSEEYRENSSPADYSKKMQQYAERFAQSSSPVDV